MATVLESLESRYGGHVFSNPSDDTEWLRCRNCHARVTTWELSEGLWPARIGRYCPEVLLLVTPDDKENKYGNHPSAQKRSGGTEGCA